MLLEASEDVRDRFFDFVRRHDNLDVLHDYEFLLDYVMAWVEHGDAIEWCAGKHGNLTGGLVLIIAKYLDDPSVLDYDDYQGTVHVTQDRRVQGLIDQDRPSVLCLSPAFWDREVFKTLSCTCRPS
jgi:hypothetical protein